MRVFDKKYLLRLWARYERLVSGVALAGGFALDVWIVKHPDSVFDNAYLLALLAIAAACIVLLNRRTLSPKTDAPETEPLALLFLLQFCFGALASNLLVLYGYSGTLSGTALFLGILGGMLVGNEFLRNRYNQLRFNLAVFYTLLLTYLIIAVPTFVLHRVGTGAFLLSGIASLAVMALFLFLLSGSARLFRGKMGVRRVAESSSIVAGILLVFVTLYVLRLIPPVPLSIKAIGTYHSIVRSPSGYEGTYEAGPWWQFWSETSAVFHVAAGGTAYCFSSIFAPTGITTPIVHHWQWYDAGARRWSTAAKVTFPITGGRDGGYYGYSMKRLHALGAWRCSVETVQGALVGRTTFTAVEGRPTVISHRL